MMHHDGGDGGDGTDHLLLGLLVDPAAGDRVDDQLVVSVLTRFPRLLSRISGILVVYV